ncbi:MAG: sporulation protein YqfD [Clostridia bacterium]
MFLKIIWNYILGFVRIEVEGYYIERFINICMKQKIFLWNVKRKNSSMMQANVGIKEFKELRDIAKKTKCRVRLTNKKGLPFLFHQYKKRKIFFLLLVLILFAILVTSNFVWNIEIVGDTENIPKEEIVESLKRNGLEIGTWKGKVDVRKIINDIRLERNDIAWMGITLKGTNAKVEIVEADKKPEIIDDSEYCNIVADKEGVITKISGQNGTNLVQARRCCPKGNDFDRRMD